MATPSGLRGPGAAIARVPHALLTALILSTASASHAASSTPTWIWPDCDAAHPCVVHHIDTVADGTAYGESLQDFKFPMAPSSAGNLLTFTVTHVSSKTVTVTDNNGGIWQSAVTTTNISDGEETELLYICGATPGTNLITVHLSQAAAHDEPLQFSYNEVSGIAPAACLDGSSAANGLKGTLAPGTILTAASGDLIYNFAEETYAYPEYDKPIGWILPDANSAILGENTYDKLASEVSVQAGPGAVSPALSVTDPYGRNWNSVAAAFKAAAGAGTQPTGIHVTRILHYLGPSTSPVSVPFPSSGNAIVISTSNPSDGWPLTNLTDNAGHVYTRTPFTNASTDPQIYFTCTGAAPGGSGLTLTWNTSTNNHVLIYDIAGANNTGGASGCLGATVNTIAGQQPMVMNAPITGDPVMTPTTVGSVILATTYLGVGPPSATLTPNAVFNSIWATNMIDASGWDTGDPYAYLYTTSTSPVSFDWQMANSTGLSSGGSYFDGAAIEILPVQYPLTSVAVSPTAPSVSAGSTQQFSATGTLSNGTQQDVTSQAAWSSSSSATATINAAGLATGVCPGNSTIGASLSGLSGQTSLQVIGLGSTATAIASSANPAPPNQSITFTAAVTSSCGTPAGTVQFMIDGANYGPAVPLSSAGISSTSVTLAAGNHVIAAAYSGSDTLLASTSAGLSEAVNTIAPTLAVTNSPVIYNGTPQAVAIGSSVPGTISNVLYSGSPTMPTAAGVYAVTATFTPADTTSYTILTGASVGTFVISRAAPMLTITNSGVVYTGGKQAAAISGSTPGTVSGVLYSGSATIPTKAGTYAVTASFTPSDSADYTPLSKVPAGSFVISQATPTLRVTSSPLTYNGSARAASVSGSVSGAVSGIQYSGSSAAPVAAGTYAITANFTPSDTTDYATLTASPAGNFVINKATPTLKLSAASATYNGNPQSPTVTRSVPGTVTLFYGGSGTAPINAGTYAVTANFAPADFTDYNSLTGTAVGSFVINKATPTITLSSSLNPSKAGSSVILTARLPASATGPVTFKNGSLTWGTGALNGGIATLTKTALAHGTYSITASYGGDNNYKTVTSGTLRQTVN